jgi:hippurate hydrolase
VLTQLKDRWKGTLMILCLPAEEVGAGARKMMADGLFTRFPRPDYALALDCDSWRPHGEIAYSDGLALANVDTVDITARGLRCRTLPGQPVVSGARPICPATVSCS